MNTCAGLGLGVSEMTVDIPPRDIPPSPVSLLSELVEPIKSLMLIISPTFAEKVTFF
jgi:hypothetical protein